MKISEEQQLLSLAAELTKSFARLNVKKNLKGLTALEREVYERRNILRSKIAELIGLNIGFVSTIIHDLKAPIMNLFGRVKSLARKVDGKDWDGIKTDIDVVLELALKLDSNLHGLTALLHRENIEIRPVGVALMIEDILVRVKHRFNFQNLNISHSISSDSNDAIATNSGIFEFKVLENLVVNAVESMESTGGNLAIEIKHIKDKVLISIADTGIGIPKKFRGDIEKGLCGNTSKPQGSGYGTSVANYFVRYFGGEISFESCRKGEDVDNLERCGTTFKISMPSIPKED